MVAGQVTFGRIAASALAVVLTDGGKIPALAGHAPAAETTLLITPGGFKADLRTMLVLLIGLGVASLLCDWGRRAVEQDFTLLRRDRAGNPSNPN